ncbi:MAG: N-acetylmuramidase [Deltaproteobacteria bacterium]|nr:N-acetylmuramidase [Deltaproteobacteria bacterium]
MADFNSAFEKMIKNEGGYVLHRVSGDRGGATYAGIARNYHPNWNGWELIDKNDLENPQLTQMVRDFYKDNFWDKIKGDDLTKQRIAESLFDFSVNAGVRTASKLAQIVVGATPDGVIGPKSIAKLNEAGEETFVTKYALAKVARYAEICNRDPSQKKFLLGWINRTLGALA